MAATAATTGPSCQYIQDLTINPANVVSTQAVQTFTAKGLRTSMSCVTSQSSTWAAAGFFVINAFCAADDVLSLVFLNLTGSAYDPASDTIHVIGI